MKTMRIRTILLLVFVATGGVLWGQEPPVMERGASGGSLSSIDNVNLRNGNVNMRIPIGPTIQIGGNLSFGLSLSYNSKVWDTQGGVYSLPIIGNIPDSYPSRKSNAGIGWSLSLGKLIPPRPDTTNPLNRTSHWMYIGPDGGNHLLYGELHENNPPMSNPNDHYSRDGSYLRLLGGAAGNAHRLEFPNGIVHVFDTQNRLVKITDRFEQANTVEIFYQVDAVSGDEEWTIQDSHNRIWKLHWSKIIVTGQHSIPEEDRTYYQLLAAEVPAPGGSRATYDFVYDRRRVAMGCFADDPENFPAEIEFLTRILLPDADGNGAQGRQFYNMVYYDDPVSNPTITPGNNPFSNYSNCANSAMQVLTIPSGGQLTYQYRDFQIHPHCNNPSDDPEFYTQKTPWVITREYLDGQNENKAKWRYQYKESTPAEGSLAPLNRCDDPSIQDQASEVLTTRVIDPKGDRTYHFFSIWPLGETSEHGFDLHDYQMPYLKPGVSISTDSLPFPTFQDSGNRYLSSLVYDCDADDSSSDSCRLYRARYLRYETENAFDDVIAGGQADSMSQDRNARVISSRIVHYFTDENGSQAQEITTDFARFDGLGHFRETTTVGYPNPTPRISRSTYNPSIPDLVLDSNHRPVNYTMWPTEDPWVLDTYTSVEQSEGNQCARMEYLFDPGTGFMEKTRRLADLTCTPRRGPDDVLSIFEHDGSGNMTRHSQYGGDTQSLGTGSLINLNPAEWVYRSEMAYQYGIQTERWDVDPQGNTILHAGRKTLDAHTGLTTRDEDAAGVSIAYQYDKLGRLIYVEQPSPFANTVIQYTNGTPTQGPQKTITEEKDGVLTKVHQQLDSFERPLNEYELMPDETYTRTDIRYGSNGLAERISVPYFVAAIGGSGQAPGYTQFKDYDPDGRPTLVLSADGKERNLEVRRQFEFLSRQGVRTSINAETQITKNLQKDDRGRIVKVVEDMGGSNTETDYEYDVLGNLSRVSMSQGATSQQRLFTYDGRGFLLAERHPEKGVSGNGWVQFSAFDTQGNPGFINDGSFRIRREYDPAGRLSQIWDDHQNLILEELFYGKNNLENGSNRVKGKLFQAKRHNYLFNGSEVLEDHVVTESYFYRDALGQLTEKRTRSSQGQSFAQHFSYDELSQLVTATYPHQHHTAFPSDPSQQVFMGYSHGALVNMQHRRDELPMEYLIRRVTYHPTKRPNLMVHGNHVSDIKPQDISGIGRPSQIYTMGADHNWDSGPLRYDGSGNIWRLGNDYFAYDSTQRLIQAQMSIGNHLYAYDRFGNMTQMEGSTLPVNPSTNRLQGSGYAYDASGNMTEGPDVTYTYDALGMVVNSINSVAEQRYLYGPGNQRIAMIGADSGEELWTLRNPQNQVIREYTRASDRAWLAKKDYFFWNGLVAGQNLIENSLHHYHLDHLRSPRLITDENAQRVSQHDYLPFGEEWTVDASDERQKFTGQERDYADQDYFHARYYNALDARFGSPDAVLGEAVNPQSWNRYAYGLNNPLKYVDLDGNDETLADNLVSETKEKLPSVVKTVAAIKGAELVAEEIAVTKLEEKVREKAATEALEEVAKRKAKHKVRKLVAGKILLRFTGASGAIFGLYDDSKDIFTAVSLIYQISSMNRAADNAHTQAYWREKLQQHGNESFLATFAGSGDIDFNNYYQAQKAANGGGPINLHKVWEAYVAQRRAEKANQTKK